MFVHPPPVAGCVTPEDTAGKPLDASPDPWQDVVCEACGRGDREDELLLCELCNEVHI